MKNDTEIPLIRSAISGDIVAYENLMKSHFPTLQRLVACKVGNSYDRDDVLQEILFTVWLNIGQLKKAESFKYWLIRVANNCCNRWYKAKNKEELIEADKLEYIMNQNARWDFTSYSELSISEELDKLPEAQRAVLVDFYYNDLKIREISKERNIPEGTVKRRLHDGRINLKKRLEENND